MQDFKNFKGSGMDSDSAREGIAPNDTDVSYNLRFAGTEEKEDGDATNIESNEKITTSLPVGLNKAIGAAPFESVRKGYAFIYNSAGYNMIVEIDYDLRTETVIYTNLTDSASANVLPLNPQFYVNDIKLIQGKYLAFTDNNMEPCYINLERLKSGGYGTLTIDDFRLIKAQPIIQPTAAYGNDSGRSVNTLRGNLFQFREQFVRLDDEYSAWGTISKRVVPSDEPTPSFGTDVTKANHLVVTVDAGTDRVKTINVAARIALLDWMLIKSIDRADVLLLPATIDIPNQIYEAYDPTTNLYSLAFYNDGLYPNIDVLETDSAYDHVPLLAGALEVLNGAILALGDITEGYERPTVDVSLSVSAYDPHIAVQQPDPTDTFHITSVVNERISGTHKRKVILYFAGTPHTGDVVTVVVRDIRDYSVTTPYTASIEVPQDGNMALALAFISTKIPNSSIEPGNGIYFQTDSYFELGSYDVNPQNAGTGVSKSIGALKTNSAYQLALAFYDKYGRYFPIVTDSRFVAKTQSYAQTGGLPSQINWNINSITAPAGAVSYQWLISENNTHQSSLYVSALLDNTLSVGDYLVFKINSLLSFNQTNSSSILSYDYTAGDRCTFQTMNEGADGTKTFFNNPSVDVEVVGFEIVIDTAPDPDVTNYLLKVRKSSAVVTADLAGNNILLEIYTPRKRVSIAGGIATNNPVLFYEFGERFDIVNGEFQTTSGTISEADSYYKTREMENAVTPSQLDSYLVEDFNFSDFYKSNYTSYGRPRTYDDEPGRVRKKASIRYSDQSLIGVKKNGLTRFYLERIYGDNPGETSSNYGAIGKLRQRDNYLVCIQELKVGHIPVNISILEDQAEKQNVSVSDKLLNYIRYIQSGNYGIGTAKESYAESQNGTIYFIDPNNSIPIRDGYDGVRPISGKMSKFFRRTIQAAVKSGKKIIGYFDNYNIEYHAATEQDGDILTSFTFSDSDWRLANTFAIPPATLTQVTAPTKGALSINTTTGKATYTPNAGETGADTFSYSFIVDGVTYTRNECGTITPGTTTINQFHFEDLIDKDISTQYTSNSILVAGNNIPVAISISAGGEYEKNGSGVWASTAGTVVAGDTIKVRQTSSASYETTTSVTLTVGSTSDSFDVTTEEASVTYNTINVRYGTDSGTVCPLEPQQVYIETPHTDIEPGITVYIMDESLVPLTGQNFIVGLDGTIYNIDSATGVVGTVTGDTCSDIPLSDFDYLVMTYGWEVGAGTDLDTFTGFIGTGTIYDGDPASRTNWVGFNQNPIPPATSGTPPANRLIPQGSSTPYLNWGTDNTGTSGVESILVDIKQFILDFPSTPDPVEVQANGAWYNTKGSGDITIGIKTYKGGTMALVGTEFVNTGGVAVADISLSFNVPIQSSTTFIADSSPIAIMSFDKSTSTATLTLQ